MIRLLLLSILAGLSWETAYTQEWTRINPEREPLTLYDIYVDSSGFGWVVGELGTVFHTTDFGQSWTEQSDIQYGNLLHLAYVEGSNGQQAVAVGSYINATQDGGQTWASWIPATNAGAYQGVAAPSAQAIYVTTNQGKLFKSQDGGISFAAMTTLPFEVEWTDIEFLNDSLGWLASRDGDLLQTTDGGQSWTVLHLATFESRIEFTWLNAQTGFMVNRKNVLRTDDGGVSWDTLAANALTFVTDDIVAIDSLTLLATQGARVSQSLDGGLTWTRFYNHPYIGTGNQALHALPDGRVWAANRWHSLLYSGDAGTTWTDQFPGFRGFLSQVGNWGADTVIAAGNGSMLIKTTNGGLDWEELTGNLPEEVDARGLALFGPEHYVLAGFYGFYVTQDGGQSRTKTDSIDAGLVSSVSQLPNGELYAPIRSNWLFHSSDSGQNWSEVPIPSPGLRYMSWANDSLGLFTGRFGQIFRSTNGGQSWDSLAVAIRANLGNSYWKSETEVFVLGESLWDSLLYSSDAGLSWEKRKMPRRTTYDEMVFADSLQGWITGGSGQSGYIFETIDGGQSWTQVMDHSAVYFGLTAYRGDSLRAWAVGQGGMIRLLGRLDSSLRDTTTTSMVGTQAERDWRLYPNPSEGWVSLSTPEAPSVPLSLEIYTLQGQRLKTHTWPQVPDRIDLRELPVGWYLLRLQQGRHWTFRKLRLY